MIVEMVERFLDTNIMLRHFLNDDPVMSPACRALIQAIEQGRETVWTTDLAIAEVVFVLSSKRRYNIPREMIRDNLLAVINLPGLKLPNKRIYARVFHLYTMLPIDFIDAYHAALMESRGAHELYSYDHDFDRIPGLTRHEP
ncbi:MAG: PIN domain-containing protein [Dehalococcoidia bacterium]